MTDHRKQPLFIEIKKAYRQREQKKQQAREHEVEEQIQKRMVPLEKQGLKANIPVFSYNIYTKQIVIGFIF